VINNSFAAATMTFRNLILYPLGLLYGAIAWLRRLYFELAGKRKESSIYTVAMGNLTVGGTGKTPLTIWLSEQLQNKKIAILSRGYGRTIKGFHEVFSDSSALNFGDEPVEMAMAAPNSRMFVSESRLAGIESIKQQFPECDLVLLDDAYQHLPLRADRYVLLCDYNRPFYADYPMPAGNLREFRFAAKGADAVVVTKCPENLGMEDALKIRRCLANYSPRIYFTTHESVRQTDEMVNEIEQGSPVIVITGIAYERAFVSMVRNTFDVKEAINYSDHQPFTLEHVGRWNKIAGDNKATGIITTRKDYVRMKPFLDALQIPVNFYFSRPKFLFDAEDDFIRRLFN
jgi:tetraacyldisaccharide 4'-kinase